MDEAGLSRVRCEELEARDTFEEESRKVARSKSWKHANDRPTGKYIHALPGGRIYL